MITPLGKRVLVKRDVGAKKTDSGIIMAATEVKTLGIVLSVGNDPDLSLKEGDRVILPLTGSLKFEHEGEALEIFLEDAIYGKFS